MTEPLCRGGSVWKILGWITIADFLQRERATLGDLKGSSYGQWIIAKKACESRRRPKAMFTIRFEPITAGGERKTITNGSQYILDRPASRCMIENLCGGND